MAGALLARLRLLRFSNFPSPIADVLAGASISLAYGGPPNPQRLAAAIVASSCVYHAGMALNDFADRKEDAKTRPDRPIPSGAVSSREALLTGLLLLAVSLAASIVAANWKVLAALAGVVLVYDLAIPRGFRIGPVFLGAARGLNLLGGIVALDYEGGLLREGSLVYPSPLSCDETAIYGVIGGYALAIAGLSYFALAEDRPWSRSRAIGGGLLAAVGILLACAAVPARHVGDWWVQTSTELFWLPFLEPLSIVLGPPRPWTPDRVGQVVGAGLRGTLVFDAIVCASTGSPYSALFCGAGYVASRLLARKIPPT